MNLAIRFEQSLAMVLNVMEIAILIMRITASQDHRLSKITKMSQTV